MSTLQRFFFLLLFCSSGIVVLYVWKATGRPATDHPRWTRGQHRNQNDERSITWTMSDQVKDLRSSIDKRGKWQQDQIRKFCSKYQFETDRKNLRNSKHFIFNEKRKFLFCFVPKVGCTYMKEFLFALAGLIPASAITEEMKEVPHDKFHAGIRKYSFYSKKVSNSRMLYMLNHYWKFTVVRNPLERLVSAFRNKLSGPLRTESHEIQFELIKRQILRKYDKPKLDEWLERKDDTNFNVTLDFEMFIKWVVSKPNQQLNDHFRPIHLLTEPCAVKYDFYGNFKDMTSDMYLVLDKLDIPKELYRGHGYYESGQNTTALVAQYYSALSTKLKQALFEDFRAEFDFYYHLFPDERHSHVRILGINEEVL